MYEFTFLIEIVDTGKCYLFHSRDTFHDMNSLIILAKSTVGVKLLFLHQYYVNEYCISTLWCTLRQLSLVTGMSKLLVLVLLKAAEVPVEFKIIAFKIVIVSCDFCVENLK